MIVRHNIFFVVAGIAVPELQCCFCCFFRAMQAAMATNLALDILFCKRFVTKQQKEIESTAEGTVRRKRLGKSYIDVKAAFQPVGGTVVEGSPHWHTFTTQPTVAVETPPAARSSPPKSPSLGSLVCSATELAGVSKWATTATFRVESSILREGYDVRDVMLGTSGSHMTEEQLEESPILRFELQIQLFALQLASDDIPLAEGEATLSLCAARLREGIVSETFVVPLASRNEELQSTERYELTLKWTFPPQPVPEARPKVAKSPVPQHHLSQPSRSPRAGGLPPGTPPPLSPLAGTNTTEEMVLRSRGSSLMDLQGSLPRSTHLDLNGKSTTCQRASASEAANATASEPHAEQTLKIPPPLSLDQSGGRPVATTSSTRRVLWSEEKGGTELQRNPDTGLVDSPRRPLSTSSPAHNSNMSLDPIAEQLSWLIHPVAVLLGVACQPDYSQSSPLVQRLAMVQQRLLHWDLVLLSLVFVAWTWQSFFYLLPPLLLVMLGGGAQGVDARGRSAQKVEEEDQREQRSVAVSELEGILLVAAKSTRVVTFVYTMLPIQLKLAVLLVWIALAATKAWLLWHITLGVAGAFSVLSIIHKSKPLDRLLLSDDLLRKALLDFLRDRSRELHFELEKLSIPYDVAAEKQHHTQNRKRPPSIVSPSAGSTNDTFSVVGAHSPSKGRSLVEAHHAQELVPRHRSADEKEAMQRYGVMPALMSPLDPPEVRRSLSHSATLKLPQRLQLEWEGAGVAEILWVNVAGGFKQYAGFGHFTLRFFVDKKPVAETSAQLLRDCRMWEGSGFAFKEKPLHHAYDGEPSAFTAATDSGRLRAVIYDRVCRTAIAEANHVRLVKEGRVDCIFRSALDNGGILVAQIVLNIMPPSQFPPQVAAPQGKPPVAKRMA